MGHIQSVAQSFRDSCACGTVKGCLDYIAQQGWLYGEYSRDDEKDKPLLKIAPDYLSGLIATRRSFAYREGTLTLIAVYSRQSEKAKLDCILHEIGHILLGHNLHNLTADAEREAEQFATYALHGKPKKDKKAIFSLSIVLIFLLAFIVGVVVFAANNIYSLTTAAPASSPTPHLDASSPPVQSASQTPKVDIEANNTGSENTLVVVTETGEKYHMPDCQYVKYKTNTTTVTLKVASLWGKEPCKVCRPPELAE